MPMKRVRNLKKRWFNMVLERALPPLPEREWERLRGLANGESTWEGPVQKRARARETVKEGEGTLLTKGFLNNRLEKQLSLRREVSCGNPHYLTKRFMQRLWGRVFTQCPVMKWNATKKVWQVQWGTVGSGCDVEQLRMVTPELRIFDGVDGKGQVPRQLQDVKASKIDCP